MLCIQRSGFFDSTEIEQGTNKKYIKKDGKKEKQREGFSECERTLCTRQFILLVSRSRGLKDSMAIIDVKN